MEYVSTRGGAGSFTSAEAIKQGLAPDGGLFVPAEIPHFAPETIADLSYPRRAAAVLKLFLPSFSAAEIEGFTQAAYSRGKFFHPAVAPVHRLTESLFFLELWHGPTCAFKDMALQVLPHLLRAAAQKTGEQAELVILTATSGDTGKAALEGFRDVPGTRVVVFYPASGVSEMQKRQMITQEGNNVFVVAVRGNFDDAQGGVKEIFADQPLVNELVARGYRLTSANSINWGRLVPQIAYYFSAYLDLVRAGSIKAGEKVNFVVPTGNFGNILAGYYARRMGLPVGRLICAVNSNRVLADFINTGIYDRNRRFYRTSSPSMDILVSSNLERLLYHLSNGDADRVGHWMGQLRKAGRYRVDTGTFHALQELFWSDYADEAETAAAIRGVYAEHRYLLDPHTAVGKAVYDKYREACGDSTKTVIVATASPFKFNTAVAGALLDQVSTGTPSEFELLEALSQATGCPVPAPLAELPHKPVRHHLTVQRDEIRRFLIETLL